MAQEVNPHVPRSLFMLPVKEAKTDAAAMFPSVPTPSRPEFWPSPAVSDVFNGEAISLAVVLRVAIARHSVAHALCPELGDPSMAKHEYNPKSWRRVTTLITRLNRIEANQGYGVPHHPPRILRELEALVSTTSAGAGASTHGAGAADESGGGSKVGTAEDGAAFGVAVAEGTGTATNSTNSASRATNHGSTSTSTGTSTSTSTGTGTGTHAGAGAGTGSPEHLRMVMMIASALELLKHRRDAGVTEEQFAAYYPLCFAHARMQRTLAMPALLAPIDATNPLLYCPAIQGLMVEDAVNFSCGCSMSAPQAALLTSCPRCGAELHHATAEHDRAHLRSRSRLKVKSRFGSVRMYCDRGYVESLPMPLRPDAGRVVRWADDADSPCPETHALGAEDAYQRTSPYCPRFCPWLSLPARCDDRVLMMQWAYSSDAAPKKCIHCKRLTFDAVCACGLIPATIPLQGCTATAVEKKEVNRHVERARLAKAAAVKMQFEAGRVSGRRGDTCAAGLKRETAGGLRISMFASSTHPPELLGKSAGYFEVVAATRIAEKPASVPM